MSNLVPVNLPDWKKRMLVVSVLYLMLEKDHTFSMLLEGDDGLMESVLDQMSASGFLDPDKSGYLVTDKGREAITKCISALDTIRQFNVASSVDLRELTPDEWLSVDKPAEVRWDILDPRFLEPDNLNGTDMRLALIQWVGEKLGNQINPYEIVFLFRLGSGQFSGPDFYFNLLNGDIFKQVEETVNNSFKWLEMDQDGDKEIASRRMQSLYTATQVENRKRDSFPCSECGIPLAMYQQDAIQNGRKLTGCPNCRHQFQPPPPEAYECPKCKNLIYPRDQVCSGCGALIDFSLPIGGMQNNISESPVVFANDYMYCSPGWIDPYDVLVSAVVFDCFYYNYW